jgi:hypothetical protein
LFVEHKQLKNLTVAADKIAHLHAASSSVQLAFAGRAPQLCRAYLFQIVGGQKTLVVVAFYLMEDQSSIFFVPKSGETPLVDVEKIYEEGYSFVESMGFVLTETDFHLLSADKKQSYWKALPIFQPPKKTVIAAQPVADTAAANNPALEKEFQEHCSRSLESLGRFLASM